MHREPYVAVTGFTNNVQMEEVSSVWPKDAPRQLALGVLVSQKTLLQVPANLNRYPYKEELIEFRTRHPRAIKVIHYTTGDRNTLEAQMKLGATWSGYQFNGWQLNMAWPPITDLLNHTHIIRPYDRIILQVGFHAIQEVNPKLYHPDSVAAKISEYDDVIDDVLFDMSGGEGKPLNHLVLEGYLKAIKSRGLNCGIGVAGGLGPDTLDLVAPLLEEFPNLSWDAESFLRDRNDHMITKEAQRYLEKSLELLSKSR